jgi:3-methyladenine DNA glycosylase AlkD
MDSGISAIRAQLRALGDSELAAHALRFFKPGPGDYGDGDRFLGIRVPVLRKLVREYRGSGTATVFALLRSPFHEERLFALLLLVDRFGRANDDCKTRIYEGYLEHLARWINNWDLVDSSVDKIVGAYLWKRSHEPLYELASSPNLWERRAAIIATFWFIRRGSFDATLSISERLLSDRQDLVHKAVGWMLREVGKRDAAAAARFLDTHYAQMPRTMLRYAIEKLGAPQRQAYLKAPVV